MYDLEFQPDQRSGEAGEASNADETDALKRLSFLITWSCMAMLGLAEPTPAISRYHHRSLLLGVDIY
jgi:hypothetical protein